MQTKTTQNPVPSAASGKEQPVGEDTSPGALSCGEKWNYCKNKVWKCTCKAQT